jgi:hypothetical protein
MLTFRPTTEGHDLHVEVQGSGIVVTLPSMIFKVGFSEVPRALADSAQQLGPRARLASGCRSLVSRACETVDERSRTW